ncbi:MAG: cobalamin-dependent protein [Chloroflexota bacterium]|nr:cobalamin-dependent protein [Chloroflexota bacterium]
MADHRTRSGERLDDLPILPPVDPDKARVAPGDLTPEILAAFLTDGDEPVARWALSQLLLGQPRAVIYDTFLRETMSIVGERWASGRWTISEEHLATQTLARVLTSLAPEDTQTQRTGPQAVLAGVAGEEHSIGLILLDHLLREGGWSVAQLGPNVPVDDLVRFVAKFGARLVALTASHAERTDTLHDTIVALRALPRAPRIMIGGRIVDIADPRALGADWTGTSVREAARFADGLRAELMDSAYS